VLDGDPAPAPPREGVQKTPLFCTSIVAKRLHISATTELLFNLTFAVKDCSSGSIHEIDVYTPHPRPSSRPSPKPYPCSQHFGFPTSALGAEAT